MLGLARSTARYKSRRNSSDEMAEKIRELSTEWIGSGYRMIYDVLREQGERVNHKRVLRLWRLQGLNRQSKRRRPRMKRTASTLAASSRANERWALDFLSDRLENGQPYRMLAVIDVLTRECVALLASRSMTAWRVVKTLDALALIRGVPNMITLDNGPELISEALKHWALTNGVTLRYSRPGTPTDNPFIESFNSRLRAECADLWWTESIPDVNLLLSAWRERYNMKRPHRSIGRIPPSKFAKAAPWIEYKAPVPMGEPA